MKKVMLIMLAVVIYALCLAGCSPYTSKYNAFAFVHSNTSDSASMSFSEFEGTMVFKLECNGGADAKICYSTKLKGGSATIYYDHDGTKQKLTSAVEGDQNKGSAKGLRGCYRHPRHRHPAILRGVSGLCFRRVRRAGSAGLCRLSA